MESNVRIICVGLTILCLFSGNFCSAGKVKSEPPKRPTVTTSQGKLEGTENLSRDGRKFNSFLGIPYGKSERWQQSTPFPKWNGTRDASKYGDSCVQYDIFTGRIYGAEECLFLNVFVPKVTNEGLLPVLFYIHGGGYQGGTSSDYGPKYFMDEDVILVTINYRVSVFGFTDTGSSSNFGLKDQILALKWVQNNIESFNGNKNLVTIFGESAGGISVSLHMLSPLSNGLFHRAISQSGTPHNPLIPVGEKPVEFLKLGHLMSCTNETTTQEELLSCLKKVNATIMITTIFNAIKTPEYPHEQVPQVVVTVEKEIEGAFLPDYPTNILTSGNYSQIPWITGADSREGYVALLVHPGIQALWKYGPDETYWNAIAPKAFSYDIEDHHISEAIMNKYFENKDPGSIHENMINLISDYTFIQPAKASAIVHAKHAPAYLYYFSLNGTTSYFNEINPPNAEGLRIPAHGDELQYLFNFPSLFPEIEAGSKFANISDNIVNLWANFAKNGNFSTNEDSESEGSNPFQWMPLSETICSGDEIEWYQLDVETKMVSESSIFGSRMQFWDTLFLKSETAAEENPEVQE